MYYVYLIRSKKDSKWYIGYTNDLKRRFSEHSKGLNFATKHRVPFELIYYEESLDKADARAREKYLKSGMGKRFLKNRLKYFLDKNTSSGL